MSEPRHAANRSSTSHAVTLPAARCISHGIICIRSCSVGRASETVTTMDPHRVRSSPGVAIRLRSRLQTAPIFCTVATQSSKQDVSSACLEEFVNLRPRRQDRAYRYVCRRTILVGTLQRAQMFLSTSVGSSGQIGICRAHWTRPSAAFCGCCRHTAMSQHSTRSCRQHWARPEVT